MEITDLTEAEVEVEVEPIELYLDTWQETPESEPGKRSWRMEKLSRCTKCGMLFLPLSSAVVEAMEREVLGE